MPSKHRYAPITPRLPRELKDRAQSAVDEMNTDLTALITAFLRWYVGDVRELPHRPVPEDQVREQESMQLVECKICRAELQKYPSYANRASDPITSHRHLITSFPRAYGRNVDSGNDIRADNCAMYGVNTGAKLAEHHLTWGWIDELTGARLCCNEDKEQRRNCARERFHEGEHRDTCGNAWLQQNHFLLTRVEIDGSIRHLNLYDTQPNAQLAASYDLGEKEHLSWKAEENAFQYRGTIPSRLAYMITYIDIGRVHEWLDSVSAR